MQRGFRSTQIPGGSSISKSLDQAFNGCFLTELILIYYVAIASCIYSQSFCKLGMEVEIGSILMQDFAQSSC